MDHTILNYPNCLLHEYHILTTQADTTDLNCIKVNTMDPIFLTPEVVYIR